MRTRLLALLTVALLLAVGCSDDTGGEVEQAGWRTDGVQAASSPVALGDTVAVVDGATTDLVLRVLDASTGRERFARAWTPSARYGGVGVGRPALFDGVVVGMQPAGFQTLLVAWDSGSGEELWKQQVAETFGPFVCGEFVCSEDNWSLDSAALVARDPATGDTRWTVPGSQTSLFSEPDLLIEQDLNLPILRSVDPANGQARWSTDLRATLGPDATPVVAAAQMAGDTLVVEVTPNPAGTNGTTGLDPATGAVKWNHPGFGLCPQPVPDVVVVCSPASGLQRLDPATGETVWSTDRFRPPTQAGPLIGVTADLGTVLGPGPEAKLIAIDLESGEVSEPPAGLSFMRFSTNEQAKKGPDTPAGRYFGPLDPVPWDAAAARPVAVDDAADLPEFVGTTVDGMRVFLDASGNVRGLESQES